MIISDGWRLLLYVLMGIFPVWQDFFTRSTDYTVRGLAMPILASASSAVAIALAKTSTKKETPAKVEVINPPENPVETHEAK